MIMFARFDENLAMTLQDIKKQNVTEGRTDNMKTVYPPQTMFGGMGYKQYTHTQTKFAGV